MYLNFYNLLMQYIFAGVEVTPHIELVVTWCATLACLFLVASPFLIVYWTFRKLL